MTGEPRAEGPTLVSGSGPLGELLITDAELAERCRKAEQGARDLQALNETLRSANRDLAEALADTEMDRDQWRHDYNSLFAQHYHLPAPAPLEVQGALAGGSSGVSPERARYIQLRWNQGVSAAVLAAELDTTTGSVKTAIHLMRSAGWDVAHRRSDVKTPAAQTPQERV